MLDDPGAAALALRMVALRHPTGNTKARLGRQIVESAQSTVVDRFVWDTVVRGFALKVTPKGKKVFVVQLRRAGRLVRYTIGEFGQTPDATGAAYTVESARRWASE